MPRSKKKNKSNKQSNKFHCFSCNKQIDNALLSNHFRNNPICEDYYHGNRSIVANISQNTNVTSNEPNQSIDSNQYEMDFAISNDLDANILNIDNPTPRKEENIQQTSKIHNTNLIIPQQSNHNENKDDSDDDDYDNLDNDSDSIVNDSTLQINILPTQNVSNNTTSMSSENNDININIQSSLPTQVDTLSYIICEVNNINSNQQNMSNCSNTSNINRPLYDFTEFQHIHYQNQMKRLPIDYATISSIKLLKLMIDGQISAIHYSNIIKWYEETSLLLHDDRNLTSNYCLSKSKENIIKKLHHYLYETINKKLSMKPIHQVISLPSERIVKISRFDIVTSIFSLLSDTDITQPKNMLISDPLYKNPNSQVLQNMSSTIFDLHQSQSFRDAHKELCKNENDILVPIIPFIDGTPIDPYGRNKLEVVMYTLGIFNLRTRNKTKSWRLAGYIPDPCHEHFGQDEYKDSNARRNETTKRTDYHHMLQYIFKDMIDLTNSNGIDWNFYDPINNTKTKYRLKFCVLFIIGDAVGNDKLCDRFVAYNINVKRLCRDCNCPTEVLDDHKHICTFTKRSEILTMSDNDLEKISHYKIENNVFDLFMFHGNICGISGSLPPEPLHQLNQGVFKKILDFFEECITSVGYSIIDRTVKYLSINSHRQSNRNYPSIHIFKDGLNKCQLSGTEVIFKIFMLYLSLIQTNSMKLLPLAEASLKDRHRQKKKISPNATNTEKEANRVYYPKIASSSHQLRKWINFLEHTLCLDAWINQSDFSKSDLIKGQDGKDNLTESKAQQALRLYMKHFVHMVNDPMGNGNKTAKLHWLLHIHRYIDMFGPPNVYSGQTPERVLSPLVKWAARHTQLRPNTIIEQSCERYYENSIIQRTFGLLQYHNLIIDKEDLDSNNSTLLKMSENLKERLFKAYGNYTVYINKDDGRFQSMVWKNKKKNNISKISIKNDIIQQVIDRLKKPDFDLESNELTCYTVLHICDSSRNLNHSFRADPYFYKRPWMDWCNSVWGDDIQNNVSALNDMDVEYPCRLLMFIDIKSLKFGKDVSYLGQFAAIVKSTSDDLRKERNHSQFK